LTLPEVAAPLDGTAAPAANPAAPAKNSRRLFISRFSLLPKSVHVL